MSTIYDDGDFIEGGNPPDSGTGSAHDFQESPTGDRGLGNVFSSWSVGCLLSGFHGDPSGGGSNYDDSLEPEPGTGHGTQTTFTSGTSIYSPPSDPNYPDFWFFNGGADFHIIGTSAISPGSHNCTLLIIPGLGGFSPSMDSVVTVQIVSIDGIQTVDVTPSTPFTTGSGGNPFSINTNSLFGRSAYFFPKITFTGCPSVNILQQATITFKTT